MAKKPQLTVVDPATTTISPPRKLGHHGLSLWNYVTSEYQIDDRGGIELLMQIRALACLGLSANGRPPAASANWSLLDQSGQKWILAGDGLSAFDPKQTFARGGKKSPDY